MARCVDGVEGEHKGARRVGRSVAASWRHNKWLGWIPAALRPGEMKRPSNAAVDTSGMQRLNPVGAINQLGAIATAEWSLTDSRGGGNGRTRE